MQYSEANGYNISKLTLGTVALGLEYGISNDKGKPAQKDSFEILSCALKEGINTLDTARSYGSAEQLIGEFLGSNEGAQPNIITKFKISPENLWNKEQARKEIYNSLQASRSFLRSGRIPFCLFHMDRKLPIGQVLEILPAIFTDLKHDGWIDIGGVSIDHPDEVASFLRHPVIEAFQVPMNIFDGRLVKSGLVQRMHVENKIVFVRSVFLQGLFFMPPDHLKGTLVKAAEYLHILQNLAKQANMSILQLAFSYIRDMPGVTSIVFGAVHVEQVKQNIDLLQGNIINAEVRESIRVLFSNIPEDIITPGLWSLNNH
jgi:aryl-alcohol dehydrogenase-like predicted oxidoreductase